MWLSECKTGKPLNEEEAMAWLIGRRHVPATLGVIPPIYGCHEIGVEPDGAVLVHQSANAQSHPVWKRIEQSARRRYRAIVGRGQ
jgi:hypothetical protein